jgi:hypothetical protein
MLAELMRMRIDLTARDKDPKEVVAKFTKLKEAATAKLAELGIIFCSFSQFQSSELCLSYPATITATTHRPSLACADAATPF